MNRRKFLKHSALVPATAAAAFALPQSVEAKSTELPKPPPLSFREERSGLKITRVRGVHFRPKRPPIEYEPTPGSWSTMNAEVASPMSVYPEYKARRSLYMVGNLGPRAVEVETDKGITGIGIGGGGAGFLIDGHLRHLLIGEDPFNVERIGDLLRRATMHYDIKGISTHAISAVDLALWDIVGKASKKPMYKLLGEETKDRIPAYCTGNDIEHHVEFGFKKLKLAVPYGPADGREGMKKNVELVARARRALGPDGEIMLDSWMSLTESYTLEFAKMLEPYRVYWLEESLPPDQYAGFRRLNQKISSLRIVTGEHEYTRYGFKVLLDYDAAKIWQPDIKWCGGMTELRHIDALAGANGIPVVPHAGWQFAGHYILTSKNSPWCEMFLPAPGGPPEVYQRFEEEFNITRGPEGIYMRPPDRPGLGHELEVW